MDLEKFLSQARSSFLKRWFDLVLETYPPQTANLMRKETNQFANPVGYNLRQGMEDLYDELLKEMDPDKVHASLDRIIRVRAIQDFAPSQAVAFIFLLKKIVREVLEGELREARISSEELAPFDSKVDRLALIAFDIYSQCREKLFEIRIEEVKNRTSRLLQRANLIAEIPERDPESKGKTT